ncbi:MAG: hypothetical protein LC772_06675 [Chloroflexi bacterium]|nr:hypothetical protein [Chloroflexota bacterium]
MPDGSVSYKTGEKRKLTATLTAPPGSTLTIVAPLPLFTLFGPTGAVVTGFNQLPVDSYTSGAAARPSAAYAADLTGFVPGTYSWSMVGWCTIAGDSEPYRWIATDILTVLPNNS